MNFGLYSTDPRVGSGTLELIAAALTIQSSQLSSWYEITLDSFFVFEKKADLPIDYCEFEFMSDLAEPDALADHTLGANKRPRCEVGVNVILNNGGALLSGSVSISAGGSHEYVETRIDPYVSEYVLFNDTQLVAKEACDPVQGDSYEIDVGGVNVSVSNFVGQRWFSHPAVAQKGPYDFMHKLTAPLTMSDGGYMVLMNQDGSFTNVFGDAMPQFLREHKAKNHRRVRHRRQIEKSIEDTKP